MQPKYYSDLYLNTNLQPQKVSLIEGIINRVDDKHSYLSFGFAYIFYSGPKFLSFGFAYL